MKTQHTPGPWATSRDAVPEWHTQITVYEEATGKRVATVFETPANAALIAAVPELVEAVADAEDCMGDAMSFIEAGQIEDALDKLCRAQDRARIMLRKINNP